MREDLDDNGLRADLEWIEEGEIPIFVPPKQPKPVVTEIIPPVDYVDESREPVKDELIAILKGRKAKGKYILIDDVLEMLRQG